MLRAASQLRPALVVRANQAGPRASGESWTSCSVSLSQTAYARDELCGSAVIDPLSSANFGLVSPWSACGALHVRPPSDERLARMARLPPLAPTSNASARWCAVPSGAMLTQGSL